jgi:hypothetical protein
MGFFSTESKSQTKMFITIPEVIPKEIPPATRTKSYNKFDVTDIASMGNPLTTILLNAAPKLIEEGLELLSGTINKFAEADVTKTIVKHNVDIINKDKISIPTSITIIRGDFTPKIDYEKGEGFGDNGKHQTTLVGAKDLYLELDVRASKDNESIAFQATKYYYNGVDREQDVIDELVLAVSFVPVEESTLNATKPTFQTFLTFENLTAHTEYEFGNEEEGYDANYQSAWMKPQIDTETPYTLIIEIQEIRKGNSFAKLLQTVYGENEEYLKTELEAKIKLMETKLKLNEAEKEKVTNE